jgi:tRNA(adenine34) deaminase
MINPFNDEYYMRKALQEAEKAAEQGEIPIGAVIVCQQQIIARAHNQTERLKDVTAHAEIVAITAAAEYLGAKYLTDCTMYVTIEPCTMCAGALAWAQVGKIVYGAAEDKRGFMRFGREMLHPKTQLAYGVLHDECAALMSNFFKTKRKG